RQPRGSLLWRLSRATARIARAKPAVMQDRILILDPEVKPPDYRVPRGRSGVGARSALETLLRDQARIRQAKEAYAQLFRGIAPAFPGPATARHGARRKPLGYPPASRSGPVQIMASFPRRPLHAGCDHPAARVLPLARRAAPRRGLQHRLRGLVGRAGARHRA